MTTHADATHLGAFVAGSLASLSLSLLVLFIVFSTTRAKQGSPSAKPYTPFKSAAQELSDRKARREWGNEGGAISSPAPGSRSLDG